VDNVSQKCIKVHKANCQDDKFVLDTKKSILETLKALQEELAILRKSMISFADLQTFY